MAAPVFISYSSKDQKIAQTLCRALETRGQDCWIAGRDVRPGENFQEAIVRALRQARVMVLVFTSNANNSEEIKKEVVLAGRHHVTVVPVRAEDVLPGDAFAYEFATRQWIDLFQDWERQVEQLAAQIDQILGTPTEKRIPSQFTSRPKTGDSFNAIAIGLAIVLLLAGGALAIWRPWQQTPRRPVSVVANAVAPAQRTAIVPTQTPALSSTPTPTLAPAATPAGSAPKSAKAAKAAAAMPAASSRKFAADKSSVVPSAAPVTAVAPLLEPAPTAADADDADWQAVGSAASRIGYGQYLKDYPTGHHAQEAQLAIANLILNGPATGNAFDGTWQTIWTCPNLGQFPGYSYQFTGQISDGAYHGQRGVKGQPSSMTLDGKIESDGGAAFFGEVIVGSSLVGLGAARGTPSDFHAIASFNGSSASGRRIEGRGCTLFFQRQ